MLRVLELSPVEQGASRLLFSAGCGENLRPQLQGLRKGMAVVEKRFLFLKRFMKDCRGDLPGGQNDVSTHAEPHEKFEPELIRANRAIRQI
jgi:hypothetical protein